MTAASTLRHLFTIREANHGLLDSIDGQMGTALGRKNGDGDPAVIVFVHRKLGEPWLPPGQVIPKEMTGPGGLTCRTDVVAGESDRDLKVRVFDRWGSDLGLRPLSALVDTNPLSPGNVKLLDGLRGSTDRVTPGCQLAYRDRASAAYSGTLGCFARDRKSRRLGVLTNQHVGEFVGNSLWFPDLDMGKVGTVTRGVLEASAADRYGASLIRPSGAQGLCRIDAGFAEVDAGLDRSVIDVRLPCLQTPSDEAGPPREELIFRELGKPQPLDLDTMAPVGEPVVGVGRTRGFQRGIIDNFAFEYLDAAGRRQYSDYLIVGDGDEEFSDPGNSGTLIVSSDGLRPLALMWGGEWARRRHGRGLQNWTNATDINFILDTLELDLVVQAADL